MPEQQNERQANSWLIACPQGSYAPGDSVLYIMHCERRPGAKVRRPNDGTKRDTVASGWFEKDEDYCRPFGQPWYEKPKPEVWKGTDTREYIYTHERVGRVIVADAWAPTDGAYLFDGLRYCRDFSLLKMDTSRCTSFRAMFRGCSSVTQMLDIDRFDTSNVRDVSDMLMNCLELRAVSIAGWDVSHIEQYDHMMSGCSSYLLAATSQEAFLERLISGHTDTGAGVWRHVSR